MTDEPETPDTALSKTALEADIALLRKNKAIKDEVLDRKIEVIRLYREGLTYEQISRRLGVRHHTISNDIFSARWSGVLLQRRVGTELTEKQKNVLSLYNQGIPYSEMLSKYGVGASLVSTAVRKAKRSGINVKWRAPHLVRERKQKIDPRQISYMGAALKQEGQHLREGSIFESETKKSLWQRIKAVFRP